MSKETIVIFSHGFGVRKDSRGFFDEIVEALKNHDELIETIQFNYNEFNQDTNTLYAIPFSEQANKLQTIIDTTAKDNLDPNIILIGHSQGSTIIGLCDISKISKIILLAPFYHTNSESFFQRYGKSNKDLEKNESISIQRTDGSTTIIPPAFFMEKKDTDIISLYNNIALQKPLYIIYPLQDQIMKFEEYNKLKNIFIMNLDGDHDFSKQYRQPLIDKIKHIITL